MQQEDAPCEAVGGRPSEAYLDDDALWAALVIALVAVAERDAKQGSREAGAWLAELRTAQPSALRLVRDTTKSHQRAA